VVDAQQVQHGGVKIVHADGVLLGGITEVVGGIEAPLPSLMAEKKAKMPLKSLEYRHEGYSMPSSVFHRVGDLPPDIRQAMGRLLGRPLEPEEHISVMAYRPHEPPAGTARAEWQTA
jgi:hypothetical protein